MSRDQSPDSAQSQLLRQAVSDRRRRIHAPSVAGVLVQSIHHLLLVSDGLERAEHRLEGGQFVVAADLLRRVADLDENLCRLGWKLRVLGHVDLRGVEARVGHDWQAAEHAARVLHLHGGEQNVAVAGLVATAGTSDAVDVLVAIWWKTDLDDMGDVGEVHAAGCYVGRDENGGCGAAETVRHASALLLGELAVHRQDLSWLERVLGEAASLLADGAEILEDAGIELYVGSGGKIDNCLERWLGWVRLCLCDLAGAQLNKRWRNVLKVLARHDMLRNLLVSWRLILIYGLDELEVWL